MSWTERIVADSTDRPNWLKLRQPMLGASDAAGFAKITSADLYTLAKLKSGSFKGNAYTESGNVWEPRMLSWFGLTQNTLLVHAEGEPSFGATPDGIEVLSSGEIILSECKAFHDQIVTKPKPTFLRQMWWAQMVFGPDCRRTRFIWQELADGAPRRLEPHILIIERDEEQIAALKKIGVIVLDGIRRARDFERELEAA
jgi:hypothetical protein